MNQEHSHPRRLTQALLLVVSIFGPALALADAAGEPMAIQNALARPGQSLDGAWKVIIDPYENGYYNHRYQPKPDGYFQDRRPQSPADLVEYSFDDGQDLVVPGDWNTQDPRLFLYEGTLWYRQQFELTPGEEQRYVLHFGAVNYRARVWLNGELAGAHEGGFTPFDLEVTGLVRPGNNTLVVMVNNQRHSDDVPTLNTDWWNYGGITRSVRLLELPATFIRDWALQLDTAQAERIRGHVLLDGHGAGLEVTVAIPEAGIAETVRADARGQAVFDLPAPEQRWSPASPVRYRVEITAGGDRVQDDIGFRTFSRRGEDILLNGRPVFLRGVSLHEEKPGGGRATRVEDASTLLGWAQSLGANFVRLAHYPHNEHTVRLAEEMGLMLWAEIPVYWTIQFDNPAVLEKARRQLTEMILRDRNRAAIVLWSLANETPVSDARLRFLRELAGTARQLDPTRLLTAALDTQGRDGDLRLIEDPLGEVVDVIGINSYCGWYVGTPQSCAGLRWQSAFGKPVIMSEFGAGALAGLHGDEGQRWTEEYQSAVYRHNIEMLQHMSFLRGASPWILMDFRSPRRPLPGIQDFWNRKGLVSEQGVRKQAFELMRAWYEERKAAYPD